MPSAIDTDADTNINKDNASETKATDMQLKKIYAMSRELNISKESMHDIINNKYGVTSSKDLTKENASDLINFLSMMEAKEVTWPPTEAVEESTTPGTRPEACGEIQT